MALKEGQYYQQGDVILRKISNLPEGLEKLNTLVIQEGETTGHMHQFNNDGTVTVYLDPTVKTDDARITPAVGKYIVVSSSEGHVACLRHEEHKTITVEPGVYQVDIVREFDYDKHEMTRVRD